MNDAVSGLEVGMNLWGEKIPGLQRIATGRPASLN
jgi:hypothetical protein